MPDKRNDQQTQQPAPNVAGRLPGMRAELLEIYQGLQKIGATSPGAGRTAQDIGKQLHAPKNKVLHALEELQGKGVVGHQTAGSETTWFTKR